ncbi:helix-turn-helix transcriptional regulator [Mucilaginibacter sp. 21P]|uniref:helix-turn-helix domain-containing protein n=1 Tax=Mucilaginibacter sp. 21P TaxID=2778902 RepID=UPI001C5931E1|nr:helix-turn-helix transcriptional regulator [Mucilaginibacter sp. 21P]QXV63638.1 helix-turn-helix transcriptional regulator [Mucilaginibacter sp. 21P]
MTDNIRRLRKTKGISQRFMAEALGISQNAYSKIECNSSRLQVQTLIVIASVLETSVNELMNFTPPAALDRSSA